MMERGDGHPGGDAHRFLYVVVLGVGSVRAQVVDAGQDRHQPRGDLGIGPVLVGPERGQRLGPSGRGTVVVESCSSCSAASRMRAMSA